jgi:hypothetical protein
VRRGRQRSRTRAPGRPCRYGGFTTSRSYDRETTRSSTYREPIQRERAAPDRSIGTSRARATRAPAFATCTSPAPRPVQTCSLSAIGGRPPELGMAITNSG